MTGTGSQLVSVVLVNFRGADDTIAAVRHLEQLDWPREQLEIVVVENASGDDSAARLKAALGDAIVLVESSVNGGFAGGCNLGVKHAKGEIVAFLNNDAKPDAGWVRAAVARFTADPRTGAVASKVVDWEGRNVDYIDAALTWFGMGYKPLTAEPLPKTEPDAHDVLFGTGSAMFVRRSVYDALGGFDERFFMFFEDVDFGWRLNLRGWRFVYEPASLAFHKHHASMDGYGAFKEQYLLERNALFALYKNLGDEALANALPAALLLATRRSVARAGIDSAQFDLRAGGSEASEITVPKDALAGPFAADQFVTALPELKKARAAVQAGRVIDDGRIWALFGDTDAPSYHDDGFIDGYEAIVDAFPVTDIPAVTRVMVITGDPLGRKMAGPAIRAWAMADALATHSVVTLVSLTGVETGMDAPFSLAHVRPGDDRAMRRLLEETDVVVFQGLALALFQSLRDSDKIIVADIYDPMHLEQLEQGRELGEVQWTKQVTDATEVLNEQLERGDFFLCASERQKHFYLGQLAALGRVNPINYADDPDLEHLISVVPFGLSTTKPVHEKPVLKGVLPGIGADDKVLLWSGGLYNWFDPLTLIRAVAEVAAQHPDVKLFFQGTKHPHPDVPEMGIVAQSRALARELGVEDVNVFFNSSWVDYADRQNYLTEADAGVSTHFAHVETTFSFRTRILDYLWAGLPMVVTEGDHFAELVEREKLGVVVKSGDAVGLAAALATVLYDDRFAAAARRNVARVRTRYEWHTVLQPLVDFVADPHHAPDLLASGAVGTGRPSPARRARQRKSGLKHDLGLAVHYLRNGGPQLVVKKVKRRLTRG